MSAVLLAVIIGGLVTAALLPPTIRALRSRRIVDVPNGRSSHTTITPRGAGLAQLPGALTALAVAGPTPLAAWIAMAGFGAIGALDDLRSMGAARRLGLQILLAGITGVLMLRQFEGSGPKMASILLVVVAGLALVYAVNATNFMDGINGISLAHGVVFSIVYGTILWNVDATEWLAVPAALLAVSLAVLPWNWGKSARVFLGDSGSYLLGAVVGVLVVVVWALGLGAVVAVAPFAIYLTDTGATLMTRALRREPLMTPHRDHVYQRLVRQGWSHPRTSLVVAAFSLVTGSIAIMVQAGTVISQVGALVVLLACCGYLLLPRLTCARCQRGEGSEQVRRAA